MVQDPKKVQLLQRKKSPEMVQETHPPGFLLLGPILVLRDCQKIRAEYCSALAQDRKNVQLLRRMKSSEGVPQAPGRGLHLLCLTLNWSRSGRSRYCFQTGRGRYYRGYCPLQHRLNVFRHSLHSGLHEILLQDLPHHFRELLLEGFQAFLG